MVEDSRRKPPSRDDGDGDRRSTGVGDFDGRETGSFAVVPPTQDVEFVEVSPTRLLVQLLPDGRLRAPSPLAREVLRDRLRNAEILPTGAGWTVLRGLDPAPPSRDQLDREVVAAGIVSERGISVIDFIGFLANSYETGILTVASGDTERSVYFHQGDVVWASSSSTEDRLGEFLLRRGKITREQLQVAIRDGEKRIGRACVERGFLAAHELWSMVQAQLTEIFDRLLAMETGLWSFSVASAQALAESQIHLSTQGLLVDALRRLDEMRVFRQEIRSAEMIIERSPLGLDADEVEARLERTVRSEAMGLFAQFPAASTVHELMRLLGKSEFEVTRLVFHLIKAGALAVVPANVEASPIARRVAFVSPTQASEVIGIYSMALHEMFGEIATIGRIDELWRAVQQFLKDRAEGRDELMKGVSIQGDGVLDEDMLIANAQRLGLTAQELSDALSEVLFFALFQATDFLGRRRGDDLARRVKVIQSMLSSSPGAATGVSR